MSKSDEDILVESREYIEMHGWTTGEFVDDEGRVCGLGGITISQGWFDVDCDIVYEEHKDDMARIARKVIRVVQPERTVEAVDDNTVPHLFTSWNDHPDTTYQQVLDAFAKAEKIERAGYDPDAA